MTELNFIDSLVAAYINEYKSSQINDYYSYEIREREMQRIKFPDTHIEPLKRCIEMQLDEFELDYEYPEIDQISKFPFDMDYATNYYSKYCIPENTSSDVMSALYYVLTEMYRDNNEEEIHKQALEENPGMTAEELNEYFDEYISEIPFNASELYYRVITAIDYNAVDKLYWDSVQEEDFDWDQWDVSHDLNLSCYIDDLSYCVNISNWDKVSLVSFDYRVIDAERCYEIAVRDALTRKIYVFSINPGVSGLEPWNNKGMTDEQYTLYCLNDRHAEYA